MPILKVNHYQSSWSNNLIDELTSELIKSDGSEVRHFEEEKIERQSRYVNRTSSSSSSSSTRSSRPPPRRGTEIPGWYKQMYSEMGNPQSITPILIKCNQINSTQQTKSTTESNRYTDRLDSLTYRPHTSNSYETESSRSSTPGRNGSMSPTRNNQTERNADSIGDLIDDHDEPIGQRQEYYPYRDAHHGKPLPGENGFTIDSLPNNLSHTGRRRYQSCSPSPKSGSPPINQPSMRYVSKSPPRIKIYSQSSRSRSQSSSQSPLSLSRSPPPPNRLANLNRRSKSVPPTNKSLKKASSFYFPLTPLPEYFSQLRHIKVTSSIPVPIPPKFGTLTQGGRWPNEAKGPVDVGPACQLCKKPIAESRFINHDKFIYHCEHFTCSHCFKTLKHDDFRMARDRKPYCNNCFKRQYP